MTLSVERDDFAACKLMAVAVCTTTDGVVAAAAVDVVGAAAEVGRLTPSVLGRSVTWTDACHDGQAN